MVDFFLFLIADMGINHYYDIDKMFNLTNGNIDYNDATDILKKAFYLSKSRLRTNNILKNINNVIESNKSLRDPTPKNIKEDILFFKDDILKDIKRFENKLNLKCDGQTSMLKDKFDKYDLKMEAMTEKISLLGNKISTNISLKEKVDELYEFKNKLQGNIMTQDVRIDTIMKDLKNAINKYENILLESVIYSGIIGVNARF